MLRALSCALFRWRGACYNKVGGTLLTNGIPATPIDAFVGEVMAQRWPMRKSQDARRPIIAASPVVFQLGTSAELADGAGAGQVAFVNG